MPGVCFLRAWLVGSLAAALVTKPPQKLVRRRGVHTALAASSSDGDVAREVVVGLEAERIFVGDRTLVEGLSLEIREGDRLVVLGANGAGKSVVAQLLARRAGCEEAEEGEGVTQRRHLGRRELEHLGFEERKMPASSSAIASTAAARPFEGRGSVVVSFESQRRLLLDEATEYGESRFSTVHLRATAASYLFPNLYPQYDDEFNYRPRRTRLAPLPVPYDALGDREELRALEEASTAGLAGALLRRFGIAALRHRPLRALSTGELRKLMVVDALLYPAKMTVLDEVFEGLDSRTQGELKTVLGELNTTLVSVVHRLDDLDAFEPTHALILHGDGANYELGDWASMQSKARARLQANTAVEEHEPTMLIRRPDPRTTGRAPERGRRRSLKQEEIPVLVEMRNVSVSYEPGVVVLSGLDWTVNRGENWFVSGGNGCGKSTLLELISGENPLAYREDVSLFGKRRGTGESIWDVKRRLGKLSTASHMAYTDFADSTLRTQGLNGAKITSWEVVLSGFFDSVGLYDVPTQEHEAIARDWVVRLGLEDLVTDSKFFTLSHGQQKLVLLCRAIVKSPKLLLLDEPTHGLSARYRDRFFGALKVLADDDDVAVVYVTHRQDEVDTLGFTNVLPLGHLKEQQPA